MIQGRGRLAFKKYELRRFATTGKIGRCRLACDPATGCGAAKAFPPQNANTNQTKFYKSTQSFKTNDQENFWVLE